MNPSSGLGSGGVSIRAAIFAMLFIGFVAASYDSLNSSAPTFAVTPSQSAAVVVAPLSSGAPASAVPASNSNGQCGQIYQTCMANPKSDKAGCETNWKNCVTTKCVKKDTATTDTCPKDTDCESSCTESATGQGGLISCCDPDPGPQHNNACEKRIDKKCTKGFAAGAESISPLGTPGSTIGFPPAGQTLQQPPVGTLSGAAQINDSFGQNAEPVPYTTIDGTHPVDIVPVAGGSAPETVDFQGQTIKNANVVTNEGALLGTDPTFLTPSSAYGMQPIASNDPTISDATMRTDAAQFAANERLMFNGNNLTTFSPEGGTVSGDATLGRLGMDSVQSAPLTAGAFNPSLGSGSPYWTPAMGNDGTIFCINSIAPGCGLSPAPTDSGTPEAQSVRDVSTGNAPEIIASQGTPAAAEDPRYAAPTSRGNESEIVASKQADVPDNRTHVPDNVPLPKARPDTAPDTSSNDKGGGAGLSSLFNGMMKGLSQALGTQQPQQAPAQACSTDPNAYAQQQQQYQQQLQQYNYQLQQQQYQQQMNQYYGNTNGIPPTPPVQPTPCTPSTQSQCSTQPSQPAASTCNSGSWQPQYSGNCIVNWKCSSSGNAPTASLSCTPSTADVGMSVSLGYSCSAGTPSGTGFTIADATQRTGTSTVTVAAPPSGTNTATYGLTCNNNGVTSGAQCSIQVTQPSIVLVANPKTVSSGGTSQIGWVTSGMQSCVISSPQQSDFTARNVSNTSVTGSASTSPITANASFRLDCTTLAGQTKSATTQVTIAGGGTSSITATSTADGTTVNHGDHVTINWTSNGEPAGAAVSFWIVDTTTNTPTVVIVGAQPLSGSYSWTVPAATSTCPTDGSYNVCGADLVAGHTYQIEADVYTPSNAYVGDGPPPSSPVLPAYGDFFTGAIFTIGQ